MSNNVLAERIKNSGSKKIVSNLLTEWLKLRYNEGYAGLNPMGKIVNGINKPLTTMKERDKMLDLMKEEFFKGKGNNGSLSTILIVQAINDVFGGPENIRAERKLSERIIASTSEDQGQWIIEKWDI